MFDQMVLFFGAIEQKAMDDLRKNGIRRKSF